MGNRLSWDKTAGSYQPEIKPSNTDAANWKKIAHSSGISYLIIATLYNEIVSTI